MGFQGSLSSVNLGDIFQTISMNRQTGTLIVNQGDDHRHIWFENGEVAVCNGRTHDGQPLLLEILQRRNLINQRDRDMLTERLYQTNQPLRELVMASGLISIHDLDEVCSWCLEENICEIFEWTDGDFSFVDGNPVQELAVLEIIEAGEIRLQTSQVVMEAMRRVDEWEQIRAVIPNPDELYLVDNEGRANLRNIESDADILKVLRYLDGRHNIDDIAHSVGIPRFDAFAIVANLIINNIARPRAPQEIVDDALELRNQGEAEQARNLLENAARRIDLPEVLRPLAELSLELADTPRAVELYLTLVERAQDDGNVELALNDLDVVIGINPEDPDLQLDRAELLVDLDRSQEASESFLAAAENFLASDDIKFAVDACHRAKDLEPTAPGPHRVLARAYMLDNQSENATVEYKSLWHVLLTHYRPRKALEELRNILEADCKFPRIKDQVLQHAGGSDAVKTGSAVRRLIYLLMLIALSSAGVYGFLFYQDKIKAGLVDTELKQIEGKISPPKEDTDFQAILADLTKLSGHSTNKEINEEVAKMRTKVQELYEAEGKRLIELTNNHLDASENTGRSDLDKAKLILSKLETRFRDTNVFKASEADLRRRYEIRDSEITVSEPLAAIAKKFNEDRDWEGAIADMQELIEQGNFPDEIEADMRSTLARYEANLGSAEFFFNEGEKLVVAGRKQDAMVLFERGTRAQGDDYKARSRSRLIELEQQTAMDIRNRIQAAIKQKDVIQTFAQFDQLKNLAKQALSEQVQTIINELQLPFEVIVDHHRTSMTVSYPDGKQVEYKAPEGHRGPWKQGLSYPATRTLTVEGKRVGFNPDLLKITAADRRLSGRLELKRGPLWQTRLNAVPVTTPIAFGKLVLTCTDRNSIELVDASLGAARRISFGDGVDSITQPPLIFRKTAYVSVSGQIHAVDIATRRKLWSWPEQTGINSSSLGKMGVFVQEHELINNQLQLFTGTADAGGVAPPKVVTLAIGEDKRTPYPTTELPDAVTAAPIVMDGVLYVASGSTLYAYESASVSKKSKLTEIYQFETRGDIKHRPLRAKVHGKAAILITEQGGSVVAVDADSSVDPNQRSISAWPLGGQPSSAPAYDEKSGIAYVSLDNGAIVALNLTDKNREPVIWRFPNQGRIAGRIKGSPAIGKHGIYVTDDIGILYCISPKGEESWRVDLGSGASTGVLALDGRIYVGTRGADLMCFEEGED